MTVTPDSFEHFTVWQESQSLAISIYSVTKSFPQDEQFGLTTQLRTSAGSISANIAIGFGRTAKKDKLQYYSLAHDSLIEVRSFLLLARRLGYVFESELVKQLQQCDSCQKLINSALNSTKRAQS